MTIRKSNLDDNSFFELNYDVYDPDTRSRYQDFSRLQTVKVIFIGEVHNTEELHRVQCETLHRLGNVTCGAFLEGFRPGEDLSRHPGWKGLPQNISLLGSDIRIHSPTKDLEGLVKYSLLAKAKPFVLEKRTNHKKLVRQQASILNEAVRNNSAVIIEEKQALAVTPALLDQLKALTLERNRELETVIEEMRSKQEISTQENLAHLTGGELKQSNEGLFQEIQKAHKQFARIIPIWGIAHLMLGDEMFSALKKAHISFMVLLPNRKSWKKAKTELEWRSETFETVSLKINHEPELKIPKIFQHFFHPSIPFIHPMIVKPTVFDSLKLLELFKAQKDQIFQWTWPAETALQLKEISTDSLIALGDDYGEGSQFRMGQPSLDTLIQSINDLLLLGNRRVAAVSLNDDNHLEIDLSKPSLFKRQHVEVKSSLPVEFKIQSGESVGSAAHLFYEMKKVGRSFKMKPGSYVLFLDITPKKLKTIMEDTTQLDKWLKSRAPLNMRVMTKGHITISESAYTTASGSIEGLKIETEKGFKISLESRGRHHAQKLLAQGSKI